MRRAKFLYRGDPLQSGLAIRRRFTAIQFIRGCSAKLSGARAVPSRSSHKRKPAHESLASSFPEPTEAPSGLGVRQGAAGSGSRLVPGDADLARDAACLDLRLFGGPESVVGFFLALPSGD